MRAVSTYICRLSIAFEQLKNSKRCTAKGGRLISRELLPIALFLKSLIQHNPSSPQTYSRILLGPQRRTGIRGPGCVAALFEAPRQKGRQGSLMRSEDLELLVTREMPFGKHKGRIIADLPGNYLNSFAREGFDSNVRNAIGKQSFELSDSRQSQRPDLADYRQPANSTHRPFPLHCCRWAS